MSKYILTIINLGILSLMMSSCRDDPGNSSFRQSVTVYKVAVVVPGSNQARWNRIVTWALDNIDKAQMGLDESIKINIEWFDEERTDLAANLEKIASDDEYVALIGPMSSGNARKAAECLKKSNKPVVFPIATSTELQRDYADCGNIWNLSQSDITQCEILLTQAKLSGNTYVSLLTSADDYGKSYSDWFAYQATELGLTIDDIYIYENESQLRDDVNKLAEIKAHAITTVIFAPSGSNDAVTFDDEYGKIKGDRQYIKFPNLLCADIVNSLEVCNRLANRDYEGVSPCANPASGFIGSYKERFGSEPVSGEAHLFDAVSIVAYALSYGGKDDLNRSIHRLMSHEYSGYSSWLPDDMAATFAKLRSGSIPNLCGVTGNWDFDRKYGTIVLNTIYSHWILRDGKYTTLEYLSTDGSDRTTSTLQAWDAMTNQFQQFDVNQPNKDYGAHDKNWAVVISTSDTWANYRHQADALAMYQLLKRHGYDDDHIILITEDNIAYNSKNPHLGYVKVRPDGDNLYKDVKVDYKLSELSIAEFEKIMTGAALGSDGDDNVIVFWTGHGASGHLYWGSYGIILTQRISSMIAAMNENGKYRKMMFVMDACYSGAIGETCSGIPGVLFITAANAYEPSKADIKDPETGIWLSNGFTRVFQETIDNNPYISIRDLYYILARGTKGSHPHIYNAENYGNLFRETLREFL